MSSPLQLCSNMQHPNSMQCQTHHLRIPPRTAHTNPANTIATAPPTIHPIPTPNLPPPLLLPPGNPFATLPVAPLSPVPVPLSKQLAVPHSYPLGQHPATGPASAPHKNHPLAQLPAVVSGIPLTGTTTVTPFPLTIVVISPWGGQDVVAQSRPVWQHPPPARARQG
jgi:hypothetical protein